MSELASRVYKVSYHARELFALVEAATPDEAVAIAKAHRLTKRLWGRQRPTGVGRGGYLHREAGDGARH